MTIAFNVVLDDLVHFNRFHWQQSPWARRSRFRSRVVVTLLGGFAGVVGAAMAGMLSPLVLLAMFAVGAAFLWTMEFLWMYFCLRVWQPRALRRVLAEGHNKKALGLHELELSDAGVFERTPHGESRQLWSSIERVVEDDRYVFIYTQATGAHVIPKAAFPDADTVSQFFSKARALHEGAKSGG